jgi:uncharacterized membrane protein
MPQPAKPGIDSVYIGLTSSDRVTFDRDSTRHALPAASKSVFSGRRGSFDCVKRDRTQTALIVAVVSVLCVVVAIGSALQGGFAFSGPRWVPGGGTLTPPKISSTPVPAASATPIKAPPPGAGLVFSWVPIAIVLGLLLIAVLALMVVYLLRHRRRPGEKSQLTIDAEFEEVSELAGNDVDADLPTLHRGLVRASEVLEVYREPRDAIVRAWLGLQEAAEDSGLRRRPSETPTEFTTRVFDSVDADRAAAATLLEVYLRVRFRRMPATEADVRLARDAIERLRESWPVMTS